MAYRISSNGQNGTVYALDMFNFITHDVDEAPRPGDRIANLRDGKVIPRHTTNDGEYSP